MKETSLRKVEVRTIGWNDVGKGKRSSVIIKLPKGDIRYFRVLFGN